MAFKTVQSSVQGNLGVQERNLGLATMTLIMLEPKSQGEKHQVDQTQFFMSVIDNLDDLTMCPHFGFEDYEIQTLII